MAYARTKKGAERRVKMKRALRRLGYSVSADITTKELEGKYKKHTGKAPPK